MHRLVVGLALVGFATPALASLETEMQRIAASVQRELDKLDVSRIHVAVPQGPAGDVRGLLQQHLVAGLEKVGTKVSSRAKHTLAGSYSRSGVRHSFQAKILDPDGNALFAFPSNFDFDVVDTGDVIRLRGATTNQRSLQGVLGDIQSERTVTISAVGRDRSRVSARRGPFKMAVLGKPTPEAEVPLAAEVDEGTAYVGVPRGEHYAVRMFNDSDQLIAVELVIDGVNVFHLSENPGWKQLGKFVVKPHSTATIPGWHLDGDEYGQFLVGSYPKSLAASIGAPASQAGTITAVIHRAVSTRPPPPADVPEPRTGAPPEPGMGAPDDPAGTAVGRTTRHETGSQRIRIGEVVGGISIRYHLADTP